MTETSGDKLHTIDIEGTVLDGLRVKISEAANDEYHWTAFAKNGAKVGTTGETYVSAEHAAKMAHELFPTVTEIEGPNGETFRLDVK